MGTTGTLGEPGLAGLAKVKFAGEKEMAGAASTLFAMQEGLVQRHYLRQEWMRQDSLYVGCGTFAFPADRSSATFLAQVGGERESTKASALQTLGCTGCFLD